MTKLLVVAGTFQQAQSYARSRGLDRRDWSFIEGERSFIGRQGNDIVFVGTYYDRRDLAGIYDQVKICQLRQVTA